MDLEKISLDNTTARESLEILDALNDLPHGTVSGLSGYGEVMARKITLDKKWGEGLEGQDAYGIISTAREKDELVLNIPGSSAISIRGNDSDIYFEHNDRKYVVSPVKQFEISRQ